MLEIKILDALLVDVRVDTADDPPPATARLSLMLPLQLLISFSQSDFVMAVDVENEDDNEDDNEDEDVVFEEVCDGFILLGY